MEGSGNQAPSVAPSSVAPSSLAPSAAGQAQPMAQPETGHDARTRKAGKRASLPPVEGRARTAPRVRPLPEWKQLGGHSAAAAPTRLHQVTSARPQPLSGANFKVWAWRTMTWGEAHDANARKPERPAAQALFEPLAIPLDLCAIQLPPATPPPNAFRVDATA